MPKPAKLKQPRQGKINPPVVMPFASQSAEAPAMKKGGKVRGCGCEKKGKTVGKMV
jgi:hypothetical protein